MWGVRDLPHAKRYQDHILGVRAAVPAMLRLFRDHGIHATWATVGLLLFDNKADLLRHLPELRPSYIDRRLSPYPHVMEIGRDEKSDPLHYGLTLADRIASTPGQELGSHTFCHYYCLEDGQNLPQFEADLTASVAAISRLSDPPRSLVFPRNQYNAAYLPVCHGHGLETIRGNEAHWAYAAGNGSSHVATRRVTRIADAYLNLTGPNGVQAKRVEGLIDIPSSRFLRPYAPSLCSLEPIRIRRITTAMESAFRGRRAFHLWWHPHNFGSHLEQNLQLLAGILRAFRRMSDLYDAPSLTMSEYAEYARADC